jgi:hypothetical protein
MIVPIYDEEWVFEKLSWDMDPSSQEPCVEDDKGEVDFSSDSAHESHHFTSQCTVSTGCMELSSESFFFMGIGFFWMKVNQKITCVTTHTILMKLNKDP